METLRAHRHEQVDTVRCSSELIDNVMAASCKLLANTFANCNACGRRESQLITYRVQSKDKSYYVQHGLQTRERHAEMVV